MNTELKTSFHALLDVTLHAAKIPKPEQPEAAKQTEDAFEKFAIAIPPLEVRKSIYIEKPDGFFWALWWSNKARMTNFHKRIYWLTQYMSYIFRLKRQNQEWTEVGYPVSKFMSDLCKNNQRISWKS